MTDARPWEELVGLVPEILPDGLVWAHDGNPSSRRWVHRDIEAYDEVEGYYTLDMPEPIAHAIIERRAVEWLAYKGYYITKGSERCAMMEEGSFGDGLVMAMGVRATDYSTALRLAVAAVAGRE